MTTDLEALEKLHATALDWDGDAASGCLNALPALIAELKAYRSLLAEFRDGYDCDEDAHTHGTQCRCCAAEAALAKVPK